MDDALSNGSRRADAAHQPTPQNVALVTDEQENDKTTSAMFQDGRSTGCITGAATFLSRRQGRPSEVSVLCRKFGRHPLEEAELGLFVWNDSKKNIVWDGVRVCVRPFRDTNPNCTRTQNYKALGVSGGNHGLYAQVGGRDSLNTCTRTGHHQRGV